MALRRIAAEQWSFSENPAKTTFLPITRPFWNPQRGSFSFWKPWNNAKHISKGQFEIRKKVVFRKKVRKFLYLRNGPRYRNAGFTIVSSVENLDKLHLYIFRKMPLKFFNLYGRMHVYILYTMQYLFVHTQSIITCVLYPNNNKVHIKYDKMEMTFHFHSVRRLAWVHPGSVIVRCQQSVLLYMSFRSLEVRHFTLKNHRKLTSSKR